ncbi:MAG: sugar ABC transporter ATP-binding protein [Parvibaculaceae bacterium]
MIEPPNSETPAIAMNGVRKAFGPTLAVDDVSFAVRAGSVHALLGENGAGKSTVVKLLSGLVQPDAGGIEIAGRPASLASPRAAHRHGIQTAFQEMTLVPDLTVLDNMMLPYAPTGITGTIKRRAARAAIEKHFARIGFAIDLDAAVGGLDLSLQQKIEIARATFRDPRILLLDEPTSTLSVSDVDWLGRLIAQLKEAGKTIVFISHRLREVRAFCDSLTILRNGRHIMTGAAGDISDQDVIEKIVGRSIAQTFPERPQGSSQAGTPVLSARDLKAGERLEEASFDLRQGEILGIAGLQGMGQLDLFHACFGMADVRHGGIEVDGRPVAITSPVDAMRPNIAIGFVPEDRKTEGLFLKLDGKVNASLPVIDRFARNGLIDRAAEEGAVARAFGAVEVHERALWTTAGSFSGGNQQKIAIAKWLVAQSRILLLFDPTRGIDVGTKHELYVMMRDFANQGGAILFHSTEIPELVHLCDRVLVLYAGRIVAEIGAGALSESAIMRPALGHEDAMTGAAA